MARQTGSQRRASQSAKREESNSGTKTKRVTKGGKVFTVTSTDGGKTWTNPKPYSGKAGLFSQVQNPFKKSEKSSKKTTGTGRKSIESSNRKIHGDKKIDALKIKHSAWKKARKEGTMDEWNKKYKKPKKSKFSSSWDQEVTYG